MTQLIDTKYNPATKQNTCQFLLDDVNDYYSLPTDGVSPGSTAIVIATGRVFMFDGRAWMVFGGVD